MHYEDRRLIDDTGRSWNRLIAYLEPDEAESLVSGGAESIAQPCGSQPYPISGEEAQALVAGLWTRAKADRRMKRRVGKSIFVAEAWASGTDHLVMFVEGPAAPRSEKWIEEHGPVSGGRSPMRP